MTSTSPKTAADVVADLDAAPVNADVTFPDQIGDTDADVLLIDRAQLGAVLRSAHESGTELRHGRGWWTLKMPQTGITVGAENFDALAADTIAALRQRVADRDPHGLSGDPLVWLVLVSTDVDLRAWLHIPA